MYCVLWANGATWRGFETLAVAESAVIQLEPRAKIGHPGDLRTGGDHTLIWECEADAADGRQAIAMILRED